MFLYSLDVLDQLGMQSHSQALLSRKILETRLQGRAWLGEMTASLVASGSLALSITVFSFTLTLLTKISKPVSDQCKSPRF